MTPRRQPPWRVGVEVVDKSVGLVSGSVLGLEPGEQANTWDEDASAESDGRQAAAGDLLLNEPPADAEQGGCFGDGQGCSRAVSEWFGRFVNRVGVMGCSFESVRRTNVVASGGVSVSVRARPLGGRARC